MTDDTAQSRADALNVHIVKSSGASESSLTGDVQEPNAVGDAASTDPVTAQTQASDKPREVGGPKGPEPTRYGDWERKGRCVDF